MLHWSPVELVSRIVKSRAGLINLASGSPDPSLIPLNELRMVFEELIEELGPLLFAYPGAGGIPQLLDALRSYCGTLGVPANELVVTSGAQHGIKLISQLLVRGGDVVITEEPTFYETVDPMRFQGARLVGIPVDEEGMRVDLLEGELRRGLRPRLIYVIPTCHNPTGVTLSLERRRYLLELASEYDLLIIEDDPYRPVSMNPPPALRSLDDEDRVIYVGSLSKILAPGLRVGFITGPRDLLEEIAKLEQHDFSTSTPMQWLAARLLSRGIDLGRAAYWYHRKLRILEESLEKYLSHHNYLKPHCGFYVTVRLGVDTEALLPRAVDAGVAYVPANRFYVSTVVHDAARLSIGAVSAEDIPKGVAIIARLVAERLKTT